MTAALLFLGSLVVVGLVAGWASGDSFRWLLGLVEYPDPGPDRPYLVVDEWPEARFIDPDGFPTVLRTHTEPGDP